MNKKKLLLLVGAVVLLFTLSGCSIPSDDGGNILISLQDVDGISNTLITSFADMWETEGLFSSIFVYPLSQFINWLTPYTNVGIAILLVSATINGILLLFTFKQNVGLQRMQTIQPQLERIQRKYEGKTDQASQMRMYQETQNLYKKYDIHPFSAMLVTFIQFPIIIAMYHAVQRSYSVAYGSFLGISLDTTPLSGITSGEWTFLLVYVAMIVCQGANIFIPMALTKYRAKKEAERQHRPYKPTKNPMGNSMYFMIILISVIAINWPTAMSLYWTISSLVQIVKTLLINFITERQAQKGA